MNPPMVGTKLRRRTRFCVSLLSAVVLGELGSAWLALSGSDRASANTHMTVAMPGATEASSGFAESPRGGGAWLMAAGTTEAHLMTPYIGAP